MAGHVDVRLVARAPLGAVWRVATDPAAWAAAGHPVQDLERVDGRMRFSVAAPDLPPHRVERVEDETARTVYSRRFGTPALRYCHVWFSCQALDEGTEMRAVADFETEPASRLDDAGLAETMRLGMLGNMAATARLAEARGLVDAAWTAIEAGDLARLRTLFAEDAELWTTSGGGRGIDHVVAVFARHRASYPDLRHEVLDAVESASGDAVALEIAFTATHRGELRGPFGPIPPTGRTVRWRSSDVVRARDGRIVSWHASFDRLALLEQLGQTAALARRPSGKAVVRRVLAEAFEEGRLEVLDEVLAPGFRTHRRPPGVPGDAGGLRTIVTMLRAAIPDLTYTVEHEVEEGDLVVAVTFAEGTRDGARVRWRQVHVLRMEDGRIAEHWGCSDSNRGAIGG